MTCKEMPTAHIEANMQLMRERLQSPYPGYPDQANRLVMPYEELERAPDGRIILPDGAWDVAEHPGGVDASREVSQEEQARLMAEGLELDAAGRPLHPWFARMIGDPLIGVVINKGAMWRWGSARTTGAVITMRDHTLLELRTDTDQWSIPGGFVDDGETTRQAMVREVREETGLEIPQGAHIARKYHGPVADVRLTAHAWPVDTTYRIDMPEDKSFPEVYCADHESTEVTWVPNAVVREDKLALFGAHRFLIQQAMKKP